MKKIEINLKGLGSLEEVHEQLKAALDFPEYYGMNLDALFDCLTDIAEDTCVGIRGPKEGGVAWYLPRLQRVFADAEKENPHLCVFFFLDEKESVQADEETIRLAAEKAADQPEQGGAVPGDPSGEEERIGPEAAGREELPGGEICAVQPDPDETAAMILRAAEPDPEDAEIMGVYGAAGKLPEE